MAGPAPRGWVVQEARNLIGRLFAWWPDCRSSPYVVCRRWSGCCCVARMSQSWETILQSAGACFGLDSVGLPAALLDQGTN
jgi:hypothetical protein